MDQTEEDIARQLEVQEILGSIRLSTDPIDEIEKLSESFIEFNRKSTIESLRSEQLQINVNDMSQNMSSMASSIERLGTIMSNAVEELKSIQSRQDIKLNAFTAKL